MSGNVIIEVSKYDVYEDGTLNRNTIRTEKFHFAEYESAKIFILSLHNLIGYIKYTRI